MTDRKYRDLVVASIGAAAGAGTLALANGCHGDKPQQDAPLPAAEIRQSVDDKKALLDTLDRIANYKRYDERDYTEVWEMLDKASREGKRQHRGFVNSAQKVGDVVGSAKDSARKLRTNAPGLEDMITRFKENARDMLNNHVSGQDPLQMALAEVPPEFWPADQLQAARQQFETFAKDVALASQLVSKLGLDVPQQAQAAASR